MANVLSSWKEIANFMGKGVRTVQRWEKQLSLPIHRPAEGHVLFAMPEELTAWMVRSVPEISDHSRTALLFGRDNELRNGLRLGLEDAGYLVLRCASAGDARNVAQVWPELDLILIGSEVDEGCLRLAQKLIAAQPRAKTLVIEPSPVADRLNSNCIRVRRPLTIQALLRVLGDEDSMVAAWPEAA